MLNVTAKKSHFRGREREEQELELHTHFAHSVDGKFSSCVWAHWNPAAVYVLRIRGDDDEVVGGGLLAAECEIMWYGAWDEIRWCASTFKWCGVDFLLSGFHSVAVWMCWNCDVMCGEEELCEGRNIIYHRVIWCVKNAQQHNKWYQQINLINFR